jgi:prophage maintenance system killer protein
MLFGYLFVYLHFTGQNLSAPSTNLVQLTLKVLKSGQFDNKKFQVISAR